MIEFNSGAHSQPGQWPTGRAEVQTVTEGGSGLTSFTLTYAGQTTASISADATAAAVKAALEALSNIDKVYVSGGPSFSEEVQTITEGGSGLTSFTLTYSGQTTASIDDDADAATVQAALEALSNLAPGDVAVTGGPLGSGPFTVTFGGTLVDTNVAQMTATPTGGTGTVTIATQTAGGAVAVRDPYEVAFGGSLDEINVEQMTATPTGGTGTVTVATATSGR